MEVMEGTSVTRPGMSFFLGTALVMCVVLVLTSIFSCLYHWSRLVKERSQYRNRRAAYDGDEVDHKVVIVLEPMPCEAPVVYMPGQALPTFIAMPSPFPHRATELAAPSSGRDSGTDYED